MNDKRHFRAKIHLNHFDSFDKNEIDVSFNMNSVLIKFLQVFIHNFDVQIHCAKANPTDPNRPLRILNRQYRLPSDIDLKTIRLNRNDSREEVDVKANKVISLFW